MGLYGVLLRGAGKLTGVTGKLALNCTGHIIGGIADIAGKPEIGETSRKIGKDIGNGVKKISIATGSTTGKVIDTAFEKISIVGGSIGAGVAKIAGAENTTIEKARTAGAIISGMGAGLIAGDVAGSTLTGIAAVHGVASTGTSISALHGAAQTNAVLAVLGGGAQAVGGGGMEAGQALLSSINAVSAVDGGIQGHKAKNGENQSKNR